MSRTFAHLLFSGLFLMYACKDNAPPPTSDDMTVSGLDMSMPDLRTPDLMSLPPDLVDATPCPFFGQTRQNGTCACAFADDRVCAQGHCCSVSQQCLPSLGASMYRCSPPAARFRAAFAYDANRKRSLLFGGAVDNYVPVTSHYELTPDTWSLLRGAALTGVPSGRSGSAITYDELNKRLLVFGGQANDMVYFNDLYAYDAAGWKKIMAVAPPAPRALSAMVYDSVRQVVVLYGGDSKPPGEDAHYDNETWELNVKTDTWSMVATGGPRALEGHAMAYDVKNKRTVLFGGTYGTFAYSQDTWSWDGTTWTQLKTTGTPNPRSYFGMAYDSTRSVISISGGETNAGLFGGLNDMWELDGTTWTLKNPVTKPAGRLANSMTYDPGRKMVLLFGGLQNDIMDFSNELWGWDGTNWTKLY